MSFKMAKSASSRMPPFAIALSIAVIAVVAVVLYQIVRNNQQADKIEINSHGLKVVLRQSENEKVTSSTIAVYVPGKGEMNLDRSTEIDTQSEFIEFTRFKPFLYLVLNQHEFDTLKSAGDGQGVLMAWLRHNDDDEPGCVTLMTLYTRQDGSHRFGARDACKLQSEPWTIRIPKIVYDVFKVQASPDLELYPFLFRAEEKVSCLQELGDRIMALTSIQIAAKCLVVGPSPGDDWIVSTDMLNVGAQLPDVQYYAHDLYSKGSLLHAYRVLETLQLFTSTDCWSLNEMGAISIRLNQNERALRDLGNAAAACPDDARVRSNRELALRNLGRSAN